MIEEIGMAENGLVFEEAAYPTTRLGRLADRLLGERHSPRRRVTRRFFRHRLALFGMGLIALVVFVAVFAPYVAPYDPVEPHFRDARQAPSSRFLLGTDDLGRDVLSRIIYATRVSASVGIVAVGIYETIAIVLGSISGYFGGRVDMIMQRFVEMVMVFPNFLIILVFIMFFGPNIYIDMLAIGLLSWPGSSRLVRGQFLQLREMDYVLAARCIGATNGRIIFKHILPGVVSPLVVDATFGVAGAIMGEAGLSFLGLGVQPPRPSWGNMLMGAQNLTKLQRMAWLWVPPGVAIAITILAINFIGDGLRDALDPKQVDV
jgi:peptide/nickel transport system permease protein